MHIEKTNALPESDPRHHALNISRALKELASQYWMCADGKTRQIAAKTLEEWYYRHRHGGFDGLLPIQRKDRGVVTPDFALPLLAIGKIPIGGSLPP